VLSLSRQSAIDRARATFDDGPFLDDLARLVAVPTESQEPASAPHLMQYLTDEVRPMAEALGFSCRIHDNPDPAFGPFLIAGRIEDPALPTVLTYGHGDVVRGHAGRWEGGRDPWTLTPDGDRLYGRGVADNKGQHLVNLTALGAVLAERGGRLGFNVTLLIETGEETGSPGLHALCDRERAALLADALIASDGPRVSPDRPTLFTGSRGAVNFDLVCDLRKGGHHSGNWGGLLANPGIILAHAIASIADAQGRILVPEWRPDSLTPAVRALLADLEIPDIPGGPAIDPDWGEPGLSAAEKVYGWNAFEVLAFRTGDPDRPVNAIPPRATAHCQVRYVVGTDGDGIVDALNRHLARAGFDRVKAVPADVSRFEATRLDPDNPWLTFARESLARTSGRPPAVLPNLGGSLPNDAFADVLGLPTIWVPHSYAACSQHAPNEHGLASILRDGLGLMAGLFWDLGEAADTLPRLASTEEALS
jgi:acetylornithine deacetylase/succinyl-diaminopimelate desuccinylase-like protein